MRKGAIAALVAVEGVLVALLVAPATVRQVVRATRALVTASPTVAPPPVDVWRAPSEVAYVPPAPPVEPVTPPTASRTLLLDGVGTGGTVPPTPTCGRRTAYRAQTQSVDGAALVAIQAINESGHAQTLLLRDEAGRYPPVPLAIAAGTPCAPTAMLWTFNLVDATAAAPHLSMHAPAGVGVTLATR